MPNHCRNRVEIYGKPDQIKEVKETLAGKKTCFDFKDCICIFSQAENSKKVWYKKHR